MAKMWKILTRTAIILGIAVPVGLLLLHYRRRKRTGVPTTTPNHSSGKELVDTVSDPVYTATPVSGSKIRLYVGLKAIQGRRDNMEDAHSVHNLKGPQAFVGVFDGHGGKLCANFAAQKLHQVLFTDQLFASERDSACKSAFLKLDDEWLKLARSHNLDDGATAITAVFDLQTCVLNVACAGDSRAVLCRNGTAVQLSVDHKPDLPAEAERVTKAGGQVRPAQISGVEVGPARVWPGGLAVSRALGDASFKSPKALVSAEPDVTSTVLDPLNDQYVILACDGLWDILSSQDACNIARRYESPQQAADELVKAAFEGGSTDNISVVVVRIAPHGDGSDSVTSADAST
eukprot:TRINITY_DN14213_c0_g1_i1.p1 TRINITY_DN14213_c0_g1~~TRINITY_DN14213_c0_g1_i1.p1  ORF type:complete len:365 (-),score=40.93 TRINITY_DN14213_c0_g1_i1:19-1056(-)